MIYICLPTAADKAADDVGADEAQLTSERNAKRQEGEGSLARSLHHGGPDSQSDMFLPCSDADLSADSLEPYSPEYPWRIGLSK